jgi:hypothetical protein
MEEGVGPWRPYLYADEDLNDSDKIITVPDGVEWQVLWIWVELTTTAAVGNRQIVVEIQDVATDVIAQPARARATQAASLTRYYLFGQSLAMDAAFYDTDYLCTPIPPTLILKEGDIIRIYDNNAVAAAADDMVVQIQYAGRSVA